MTVSVEAVPGERRPRPPELLCTVTLPSGDRCGSYFSKKVLEATGERKCSGHGGLGLAESPEAAAAFARQRHEAEAAVEAERADRILMLPRNTREAAALLAEDLREEIEAAYRDAIVVGSLSALRRAQAAELLLSRVYGRPTEFVETSAGTPAALRDIQSMLPEERAELLRQMGDGKLLRLVDGPAPGSGAEGA